ncbi:sensor histidine kinase [Lacrimispora sp. AGF001]|uniref:sensor histidine kinase n=1 Tax=Lacrimispora sp. AGF001 TaxID=3401631 RepID=UPI003B42DF8F
MKKRFRSIRYKFILSMTAVFLLFSFLVLGIWYQALKQEAASTAIHNSEHLLEVSNTIFENQVQDIINVAALTSVRSSNSLSANILTILSRNDLTGAEIVSYRKIASDYLISLCSFKSNLNGLMLSDFNGNTITYGIPTSYETMARNNWISLIKDSQESLVLIPPHFPSQWYNTQKDMAFSVLKPVFDYNNKKIGFVIADINSDLFQECFDTSSPSPSSLYVINRNDGRVLFCPSFNLLNMELNKEVLPEITNHISSSSGHFLMMSPEQEKMLVVYHTSSLTNWTTLSVIPEKEIVTAFTSTLHNIILITLILLFLLIGTVFFITTLLTRQIRILANAVKQIDGDYLDFNVSIQTKDEIGALSSQFQAMLKRIKLLLLEVKKEEEGKRRAEISALQFQMNPHFLYNTLNTIKFLSSLQGAENIGNVAQSLSSLMHINMDGRSFLKAEEDGEFVTSYLEIQNYRYTNAFQSRIRVSEEARSCMVPKLLVQPLVENSLKHGLKDKASGGILLVDYLLDEEFLKIIVEDNGLGMDDERIHEIMNHNQNENAGHIGIHNIRERLHMYFGNNYEMEIISQPGVFTRFEILLPIITENEVSHYVPNFNR